MTPQADITALPATFPLDIDAFIAGLDSPWHSPESRAAWVRLFFRDMQRAAAARASGALAHFPKGIGVSGITNRLCAVCGESWPCRDALAAQPQPAILPRGGMCFQGEWIVPREPGSAPEAQP